MREHVRDWKIWSMMFLAASTSVALRGRGPSIGSCGPTIRAAAATTHFTDRASAVIRKVDEPVAKESCAAIVHLSLTLTVSRTLHSQQLASAFRSASAAPASSTAMTTWGDPVVNYLSVCELGQI